VTAGVGTVVGWATFGCAIVATPAGPVFVALASGACAAVARRGGTELVRVGFERFAGRSLDESALNAGVLVGTMVGARVGAKGAGELIHWLHFRHFKDFGGYAKMARSLTQQSLVPVKAQVSTLRVNGFDIDHIIPVKCGWAMRIAPEVIASLDNLHALPA